MSTPIQDFYKNKSIFLTGATGAIGKLIIDKLLRCCDVKQIFILIRKKHGKNTNTRCDEIFDDLLFEALKTLRPDFRHKIVGIDGDLVLPALGISSEDRKILRENVTIIFHLAANIRLDEKLAISITCNVKATKDIINLAEELVNLEALVYVSTAYSNSNHFYIEEKIYESTFTGEQAITLLTCLDEEAIEFMAPQIAGKWPNNYVFSKHLAESLFKTVPDRLPVGIFRPSIVIPTYREPVAGWLSNMHGPTSIFVGCAVGLIRVAFINGDVRTSLIPADMCVNALLSCAWDVHKSANLNHCVYNYIDDSKNSLTWAQYAEYMKQGINQFPLLQSMWVFCITLTTNRFLYFLLSLLYHKIPGFVIDAGMFVFGKKPRMLKQYKKMDGVLKLLRRYVLNTFQFSNKNIQNLWSKLDPEDRKLFFFDMSTINWRDVLVPNCYGVRKYLLKQNIDTIPQALKKQKKLQIIHCVSLYISYTAGIYLIYIFIKFILNIYLYCWNQ